jgi:uncharacterized membrane protein
MTSASRRLDTEAQRLLGIRFRQLSSEERRVIKQIIRRAAIARNMVDEEDAKETFGQRLADRVAAIGGSWAFIIGFGTILVLWIGLNSLALHAMGLKAFDPYPYIFLNLMLSMVAALQAPVIMMSQNRQGLKDRSRAEHDYEVNLKAELEIMGLHDKLDALRSQDLAGLLASQGALLQELRDANGPGLSRT